MKTGVERRQLGKRRDDVVDFGSNAIDNVDFIHTKPTMKGINSAPTCTTASDHERRLCLPVFQIFLCRDILQKRFSNPDAVRVGPDVPPAGIVPPDEDGVDGPDGDSLVSNFVDERDESHFMGHGHCRADAGVLRQLFVRKKKCCEGQELANA